MFKGGVSYTNTITVNWSGTTGSSITYDGNSAGTWGSGKAVFNGNNSTNQIYGFYGSGKSNLVFRNIESKLWGGHGSLPWSCDTPQAYKGWGIYLDGCAYVTIRDSYFHDIGDWQNATNINGDYLEGTGVEVINSGWGVTVTNCDFTHMGRSGIQIEPFQGLGICTNILIVNNKFHDYIRWSIDLASAADNCTLSDVVIDGNQIYDLYQYDAASWLGCAGSWPHTDPIIMRLGNVPSVGGQTLGTTNQPIIVRNNTFYQNSPAQYGAGTAAIFLTAFGGRLLIYNNTFINVLFHGEGAIYVQDGTDPSVNPKARPDYHFYNNTFFGDTYCIVLRTLDSSYALTNGTFRIKNNVFYKTDDSAAFQFISGLDAVSNPTELDYNVYYTPARSDKQVAYIRWGGAGHYEDFPGLQAQGFETHGVYTNPAFANTSYGLGTNSSLNDLHLQTNSPSIGRGANLSSVFTADKDGKARPALGAWDVGAFQSADPRQRIFLIRP